jgi:hypothetical protein
METLRQYGKLERLENAKELVKSGAKFNGVVYGEKYNKKTMNLLVYINNVKTYIKAVENEDVEVCKKEVLNYLLGTIENSSKKTTWIVDGKEVSNNLDYAQMYDIHGMDFE